MKKRMIIGAISTALFITTAAWAQTGADPIAGSSILGVEVKVLKSMASGYRASKLLGSDIYNDQGEKIGKVDDFLVGSDNNVSVAIVSVGGFLGIGAKLVAVPAGSFESNDNGQTVLPGANKKELMKLPEFHYTN